MNPQKSFSLRNAFLLTVVGVALAGSSTVWATTIALSENNSALGLNLSPTDLNAAFTSLGPGDMVFSSTDDISLFKSGGAVNVGNDVHLGGNNSHHILIKFDLSAIPVGSTINSAQLQLWGHSGNNTISGSSFGVITTHDWSEGAATPNSPTGAVGPDWGPGSDAVFDVGAGGDVPVTTPIDTRNGFFTYSKVPPPGNVFSYYLIEDVTTSLQSFVDGSVPNYGWGMDALNYGAISSSESTETNGFATGGSFGAETGPILFVDYTPAVIPEPTSALLLSVGLGLAGIRCRR